MEMVIDKTPEKLLFIKSLQELTSTCWTMITQNNPEGSDPQANFKSKRVKQK